MKNKKTFIIASIIMIIMLCAAFTVRTFQNDTYYTVKVGESILEHGIDMKDHFSWHELDYTYPHWLFDIIVYKLHEFGGLNILYITTKKLLNLESKIIVLLTSLLKLLIYILSP